MCALRITDYKPNSCHIVLPFCLFMVFFTVHALYTRKNSPITKRCVTKIGDTYYFLQTKFYASQIWRDSRVLNFVWWWDSRGYLYILHHRRTTRTRARYARFAELFRWHPRFPELLYGILIYSPKKHILELYHAYSARRACWLRQIPQNPISERKPLLSLCALRARHVLDSHLAI